MAQEKRGNAGLRAAMEKPREPSRVETMAALVEKNAEQFARALPEHIKPERMIRMAMTALRTVPKLAECDPMSFMGCLMQLAQLGLEPNTPLMQAWLIPRNMWDPRTREKRMTCTAVIGYQGLIDLALRTGVVSGIFSHVVRHGDQFRYELGLDPKLTHVPSDDPDREIQKITHVYAVARIVDGDPIFVCLSRAQVEARRERSDGYQYQVKKGKQDNPWFTDEEAMFQKTAVRALSKWVPKSVEMARAIKLEDAGSSGAVATGFDAPVVHALASGGYEAAAFDEDADQEPGHDPETGEVIQADPVTDPMDADPSQAPEEQP